MVLSLYSLECVSQSTGKICCCGLAIRTRELSGDFKSYAHHLRVAAVPPCPICDFVFKRSKFSQLDLAVGVYSGDNTLLKEYFGRLPETWSARVCNEN